MPLCSLIIRSMKQNPTKLSAVIIAFNEEKYIAECIRSIREIADEIIVVDSFSSDLTPEICRKFGVILIQHTYTGQIEQKNHGLTMTSYDYVLSIDADESLSESLQVAISREKKAGFPADGYRFNRLTNYCGQWIRHGGWYPDQKLRLWNKHRANWAGSNPHDRVIMTSGSQVRTLSGDLLHHGFESVSEHNSRIPEYAQLGAQSLYQRGKKFHYSQLIIHPGVKFLRDYVFRLGFLDGHAGWIIATRSAKSKYLKYLALKRICNS